MKRNNVKDFRIWLLLNDIKPSDIAKDCEVTRGFITHFMYGRRSSKGMVEYLISRGCPAEWFDGGKLKAA